MLKKKSSWKNEDYFHLQHQVVLSARPKCDVKKKKKRFSLECKSRRKRNGQRRKKGKCSTTKVSDIIDLPILIPPATKVFLFHSWNRKKKFRWNCNYLSHRKKKFSTVWPTFQALRNSFTTHQNYWNSHHFYAFVFKIDSKKMFF